MSGEIPRIIYEGTQLEQDTQTHESEPSVERVVPLVADLAFMAIAPNFVPVEELFVLSSAVTTVKAGDKLKFEEV